MGKKKNKTILVTGGAGFIGKRLIKRLAKKDLTIVSLYRKKLPEPMPNVYPVCSDCESKELLLAPLRDVDTVIHLAFDEEENPEVHPKDSANNRCFQNLLRAMEEVSQRKLILVSAFGSSRHHPSYFLREKYYAEVAALNAELERVTIVRPTIVFDGKEDRLTKALVQKTRYPLFYPVPQASGSLAPIYIDDFAKLLEDLIFVAPSGPKVSVVDLFAKEQIKWEEAFRLVADRHYRSRKFQLRGILGEWVAQVMDHLAPPKGLPRGGGLERLLDLSVPLLEARERAWETDVGYRAILQGGD